jgi:hypothetical protein
MINSESTAHPSAKAIVDRTNTRIAEAAILYTTYALMRAKILLDSRTAPLKVEVRESMKRWVFVIWIHTSH